MHKEVVCEELISNHFVYYQEWEEVVLYNQYFYPDKFKLSYNCRRILKCYRIM